VIDRRELLAHAGNLGLRPDVVEKDYILGWLLAGISNHPALANTWVFKGGTCLKKCYFETGSQKTSISPSRTNPIST
jgi:predicted nucleotidyltransferase component of viral defense system